MLEGSSIARGSGPFWLLVCAVVALGVSVAPGAAFAQASPAEKAVAESLFVEGKKLMTEGRHAEACPKLEQSQAIEAAIGTMLYLAECYEKTGRAASAWAMFREASSRARAEGQLDRAQVGAERAKVLEPRLSKLTVVVDPQGAPADLHLALDGRALPLSLQGTAIPVDGGEHVVTAEAPGYEPFSAQVVVKDPADSATVMVPALKPVPVVEEAPAEPPPARAVEADAAPVVPEESGSQRIVGLALSGAGLLGIGAGVYFGLEASDKDDQANEVCPRPDPCNVQSGIDLTEEAQSDALVANILYGVGGAAVIAGAILFLTADSAEEASAAQLPSLDLAGAKFQPDAVISPTYSGVSLQTEF